MRPRALLICIDPLPLTGGDSIYTYGIALRLAALYELDVLALALHRAHEQEADTLRASLASVCRELRPVVPGRNESCATYRFVHNWSSRVHSGALIEALRRQLAERSYDGVFLDHLRLAYLLPIVRRAAPRVPIAAIHHNIEHDNVREELGVEPSWKRRAILRIKNARLRSVESAFSTSADVSYFISEQDRRAGTALGAHDARLLPAYFPFPRTKPEDELRRPCSRWLLLGSLGWYPNYLGAVWFVQEALPGLRREHPDARVVIVGDAGGGALAPLRAEGVELRGFVQDVEPVFREADLLVVPNELGGGAKMKILEALGRGLPVVAHDHSTHGLPRSLFAEGFCAGTRAELATRVLAAARDVEARVRFARRGLQCLHERADLAPEAVAGLGY